MQSSPKQQEEAFVQAFHTYQDALFRHSFFRISNRQASIDLVQEAFTKTWLQISKGEEILNFQSYLYHVLNNLIIDYYRKRKSVSLDSLADDGFDPKGSTGNEIFAHAEYGQLLKRLETLPQQDRDVVIMRHVDGLQIKHIAQVLGETENSVSVRLHRAVKKLKQYFHEHE
jgi:RNA polymerase sigma-70 factor (ECF subfamily)